MSAGVCASCGFEVDRPEILLTVNVASQSPRYSIQPLEGLGSQTPYTALKLQFRGRNIAHLVKRPQDPLLERCKSELWQALKEVIPLDHVVEEATKILTKEVRELEYRYSRSSDFAQGQGADSPERAFDHGPEIPGTQEVCLCAICFGWRETLSELEEEEYVRVPRAQLEAWIAELRRLRAVKDP